MAERLVCVAIKPVAPVLEVDWLTGAVRTDARHLVRTAADAAACAVGLELAASLRATSCVIAVGGPAMGDVLLAVVAEGADRAVRVAMEGDDRDALDPSDQWPSDVVATAIAHVAADAAVVVCGDASGDRGSATVPSMVAHLLSYPQALGARDVAVVDESIVATRRLDGGRRERVAVDTPCVVSVEAAAGHAPRAALSRVLAAGGVAVTRVAVPAGARRGDDPAATVGAYRARPSLVAAPAAHDPVLRAVELAGSLVDRDPPEVLHVDPDGAAAAILERLERWGLR